VLTVAWVFPDNRPVALCACYTLERVARDSPKDQPTVVKVLAAFIRENSREQWPLPGSGHSRDRLTRPDVQTALDVIGGRDTSHDEHRSIDLSDADLTCAYLREANFKRAALPRATLTGANLTGAILADAKLTDADLTNARLPEADLTGADLTGADLTGADLTGADLTGASWPSDAVVPVNWQRDVGSGRLMRCGRPPTDLAPAAKTLVATGSCGGRYHTDRQPGTWQASWPGCAA
jgi:hypothetical protein